MYSAPNQKLLEWVRRFKADLTPEGNITRLELWHTVEGEPGERITTFEMSDRDDDEDPDDFAQEIWNEVEDDASTRPSGSHQRYVIQAYRGGGVEPDDQKAFTTQGKCVTAMVGAGSEPATPRGELAQAMRERNDLHGLIVRMCEHGALGIGEQLVKERQENARLHSVAYEYEKLRQQLLDRSNERAIELAQAQANGEMLKALTGTLLQFAPFILQKLLAPPPVAGAAMPLQPPATAAAPPPPLSTEVQLRDAAIHSLLGSMKPDQLPALLGAFNDEQKQAFIKVYQSYREHPPESPPSPPSSN